MNKIFHGDSLEVLKTLEADSVDVCVTDPPYAISFMNRAWDRALPDVGIFKETLRVLKPGAFAFVMSAPRSDVCSRMSLLLEEAGFNIAFTPIYWTYASGFPKAMNIGKMVDKRNGRSPDIYKEVGRHIREKREAAGLTLKQMNAAFGYVAGCTWWENQNDSLVRLPNLEDWRKLVELIGVDDKYTEVVQREEAEREVLATRRQTVGGNGVYGEYADQVDVTIAATDAAKALDGSYGGFQPKPAVEVIIVAMKPLSEKTYVDQALKNGKGITWLDDCRVPTTQDEHEQMQTNRMANRTIRAGEVAKGYGMKPQGLIGSEQKQGRFPANLLVSDDVLNDGTSSKSVARKGVSNTISTPTTSIGGGQKSPENDGYSDSGGYSRFFSLDAWAQTLPFLAVPKASKSEKNAGLGHVPPKDGSQRQVASEWKVDVRHPDGGYATAPQTKQSNNHPTVKPLKLMSYLITLGSRPGDTVLDPFVGSGTTCIAAKELGRNFIGIEREREYCDIAEARLAAVNPTLV